MVTCFPSFPTNGPLLTIISTERVGSASVNRRELDDVLRIAEGISNHDFRDPGDADDIAYTSFFHFDFFQAKVAFNS